MWVETGRSGIRPKRVVRMTTSRLYFLLCLVQSTLTTVIAWVGTANSRISLRQMRRYDLLPLEKESNHNHYCYTALYAKKATKGKRKSSTTTITKGFGASSSSSSKTVALPKTNTVKLNADYDVFPQLEVRVRDSLVPTPSILANEAGVLTDEVYDRLAQIYGFKNFNYQQHQHQQPQDGSISLLSAIQLDDDKNSTDNLQQQQQQQRDGTNLSLDLLPEFEKFRVLHMDPLVLAVDDFFTHDECDRYVQMSIAKEEQYDVHESRSPTVGKDAAAKAQRTSTTFYHHYKNVPEFVGKASRLFGLDSITNWEEPQTVRYRKNEKFTWHLDALGPTDMAHGGQRVATLLVYLTQLDEKDGGATIFRDLKSIGRVDHQGESVKSNNGDATVDKDGSNRLRIQPRKGSALLFFPAAGGIPNVPFDIRTLHCGEVVSPNALQDKWICQLWLRQFPYKPTAPKGNSHADAIEEINKYCNTR